MEVAYTRIKPKHFLVLGRRDRRYRLQDRCQALHKESVLPLVVLGEICKVKYEGTRRTRRTEILVLGNVCALHVGRRLGVNVRERERRWAAKRQTHAAVQIEQFLDNGQLLPICKEHTYPKYCASALVLFRDHLEARAVAIYITIFSAKSEAQKTVARSPSCQPCGQHPSEIILGPTNPLSKFCNETLG